MSLLTVSNLAKSFGPVDIFAGVTFSLPHRARFAIVGPNGVGKTTLLRVLAGEDSISAGNIHLARGTSLGYLPQEAGLNATHTLWEECLTAFREVRRQEIELKRLEAVMSDPDQVEAVLERYGTLQAEFERQGGYDYESRIRRVLTGLGFEPNDYSSPLNQLSGGQRTRALLARLLLSIHDLLLLDEPSNHLDIAAIEWLEGFLKDWDGAALFVSHDRYFTDKVATNILEMFRGSMETYRGNYTAYLAQREARWVQRQEYFESEKSRLEKELDYIKRNIAGQRTQQAKGKLRRLSRYLEVVEQLGFEGVRGRKWGKIAEEVDYGKPMGIAEAESRIKALHPPASNHHKLNLRLQPKQRSGKIILRTQDLQIGYPGNVLFTTTNIELHRLKCAAIIGPNGAGKSTFLKTILGQLLPLVGEITLGASLDIAYFAQAHEDLNPNHTLIEEIDTVAPRMLPAETRNYLARFSFIGEDVFKPISVLSGGERGRLALAKLALTDANLLLLDEPTNHLDIPAQEILQEALSNFEGTIILVSHDRYLIDALATQIWEIHPARGPLGVFKGTYTEYKDHREVAEDTNAQSVKTRSRKGSRMPDARAKNRALAAERRRKQRLKEAETLITILEEQLSALSQQLENPPADPAKVQKLGEEYVRVHARLEGLVREWEGLHE